MPKAEQSLAYLLKNEILSNVEDLRAELEYLIPRPEESDTDARTYAVAADTAMQRYLQQIVPPSELEIAQALRLQTPSTAAK